MTAICLTPDHHSSMSEGRPRPTTPPPSSFSSTSRASMSTHSNKRQRNCNNSNSKKQVHFYPRVKTRRVIVPMTDVERQACWYSSQELQARIRKDRKLRAAVASYANSNTDTDNDDASHRFDSDCLCRIGLYTEQDRKNRYRRAQQARFVVVFEQQQQQQQQQQDCTTAGCSSSTTSSTVSNDTATTSSITSSSTTATTNTTTSSTTTTTPVMYSTFSEMASRIAYKRGLEQARHVQALWGQQQQQQLLETTPPPPSDCSLATVSIEQAQNCDPHQQDDCNDADMDTL
eukprot:scaffold3236_cov66-Cylindrotheca_fusiformis.AAC.18